MNNVFSNPARKLEGSDYAQLLAQAVDNNLAGFRCGINADGLYTLSLYWAADATLESQTVIECGIATEQTADEDGQITHIHVTDLTIRDEVATKCGEDIKLNAISQLDISELQPSIAALFHRHNQRVVDNEDTQGDTKIYSISRFF